ncbi:hypothetical protein QOT17_011778 [Balamuthia mandrillaris]
MSLAHACGRAFQNNVWSPGRRALGTLVARSRGASRPGAGATATLSSPFLRSYEWYRHKLHTHPVPVKALTSGTLLGLADFLAQKIKSSCPAPHVSGAHVSSSSSTASSSCEGDAQSSLELIAPGLDWPEAYYQAANDHQGHELQKAGRQNLWDKRQTFLMCLYGALFVAPFAHTWYRFLHQRFPVQKGARTLQRWKQTLKRTVVDQSVAAPIFTTGLFVSRGLVAGQDADSIQQKMRQDFLKVFVAGLCVWPLAQFVNFTYVPLAYQVLFNNVVGLGWSTFSSLVACYGQPEYAHLQSTKPQPQAANNRSSWPYSRPSGGTTKEDRQPVMSYHLFQLYPSRCQCYFSPAVAPLPLPVVASASNSYPLAWVQRLYESGTPSMFSCPAGLLNSPLFSFNRTG